MKKTDTTIRFVPEKERAGWDWVVAHPLQSWAWGEFRTAMGIDVVRLAVTKNNTLAEGTRPELAEGTRPELAEGTRPELAEGWQLTFHRVPYIPYTIGYFPKGPTITREMLAALETLGKQKRAIFIQLEPNSIGNWKLEIGNYGLRPSHHPLFTKHTFVLDLNKSEKELLKTMHPKTRYNIRLAQKHGVTVQEDNSPAAFDQYLQLVQETTSRQGFYAHNQTYHRRMWKTLRPAGIARLWTATYQGETLATWIIFIWKDTIYYPYGASSREHRDVMAPTLLLWEIARWGKRQGYRAFDLWGALGPNPDKHDPWYGFHRFKQGFNPDLVEFIGSFDLVLNPFLYRVYTVADRIRWKILK